jgi:Rod binding domain-containing protein
MTQVSQSMAAAGSATSAAAMNPRLKPAAHEFEACLMKEFLEPLQHDSLFAENRDGEGGSSESSNGALMSFGSEALAKAISERGGFGIATKIIGHFEASNRPADHTCRKILGSS